ncbi:MAG: helix-turn-helix transcriptional regulator [candidate division WOR-3 bacterium]|nr:helix-turn-helix transcriptional regulator [candidate division WOR-3 bacterium]
MIEKAKWYEEMRKEFDNDPEYWAEGLKLDFAEEVGRLMEEQKISRAELARRLGTSPAYVTKILHWTANLTLASMSKIALVFGSRVYLRLAPKNVPPGRRAVAVPSTRRRGRQPEFVAADRPVRARRNDFVASDKPARRKA